MTDLWKRAAVGSRRHFRFGIGELYKSMGSLTLNAALTLSEKAAGSFALAIGLVDLGLPLLVSRGSPEPTEAKIDDCRNQLGIQNRLASPLTLSPGGDVPRPIVPKPNPFGGKQFGIAYICIFHRIYRRRDGINHEDNHERHSGTENNDNALSTDQVRNIHKKHGRGEVIVSEIIQEI